jgi:hypothetical protein
LLPQLGNHLRERLSFDILHGVVMHAALAADAEDRHNTGMVQVRRRLGFVLEALQRLGIEGCRGKIFRATRRPKEICSVW